MLGRYDHEGNTEQRITACCVDLELIIGTIYGEIYKRTGRFTYPVALLLLYVFGIIDHVKSLEQLVRIFGYFEVPYVL